MFPQGYGSFDPAFGLQQWTRTRQGSGFHSVDHRTRYNNGFSRLGFNVHSTLPVNSAQVNYQAREFSNFAFNPVLCHLGNQGVIDLPNSLKSNCYSNYTDWGGNPQPVSYPPPPPVGPYGPVPFGGIPVDDMGYGFPNNYGGNSLAIASLMQQITQVLQIKVLLQNITINKGDGEGSGT